MDGLVKVDDLTDLWRAGAVKLPTVAAQYSAIARALHRTARSQEGAFWRSDGSHSPLHHAWTRLRDTMQDEIAVRSYENLINAGSALMQIADAYATTDYLSLNDLNSYEGNKQDILLHDKPENRPPVVPVPPSSGEPQLERPAVPVWLDEPF